MWGTYDDRGIRVCRLEMGNPEMPLVPVYQLIAASGSYSNGKRPSLRDSDEEGTYMR